MKRKRPFLSSLSVIATLLASMFGYCQPDEFKLEKVKENLYMIGNPVAGNVSLFLTGFGHNLDTAL